MKKFNLCVHGHFYQPPRENPGLDEVEIQDSAYPFHDWNERVTAECYAPNTCARIVDAQGKILNIINNYSRISFNFGPTLLAWLERHAGDVYKKILEADQISVGAHQGHGNAMAQIYNHIIMPLTSLRDKETQVIWGIRDFEKRFMRKPEGMWLSETAVDLETLEILATNGIRFTLLSPYQAWRVRPLGSNSEWMDVTGAKIDPSHAYKLLLPSGRSIDLFFYDGPISFGLAFDDSLSSGEVLAHKMKGGFSHHRSWNQILPIATDGESYGHHRKFGEMALAYALEKIINENEMGLTNFGEYLEACPSEWEVQIYENSSWSCAHGVGRWSEDCGCRTEHYRGWNQKWRKPLREGLNSLKEKLDELFERELKPLLNDPWKARNDYIDVVIDRNPETINAFLKSHAPQIVLEDDKVKIIKLMEIERNAMLMFTSCGWFFDEISGLEPVQILNYADRAIQLAKDFGENLENPFSSYLSKAKSNLKEWGTGLGVYEKAVKPARVDFNRAMAHWAISSLFESYPEQSTLYSYEYRSLGIERLAGDGVSFSVGRVCVTSKITLESKEMAFALLFLGGPDFHCVTWRNVESFDAFKAESIKKFNGKFFKEIIFQMRQEKVGSYWTLKNLFLDEKRKILNLVTEENLLKLEESLKEFYEKNRSVMEHLREEEIPLPKAFHSSVEYVLMRSLERVIKVFSEKDGVLKEMKAILEEAKHWDIALDLTSLRGVLETQLEKLFFQNDFKSIEKILDFSNEEVLNVSLWKIQNLFFDVLQKDSSDIAIKNFESLGKKLGFHQKFFEMPVKV